MTTRTSGSVDSAARRLRLEGLRDLLAVVNSSRGLDEILSYLVATAQTVLEADGATVYLRDAADPHLVRVHASRGVEPGLLAETTPIGYPVTGLAVERCRPVVIASMAEALARPFGPSIDAQCEDRGTYLEVTRPGPTTVDDAEQQARNRQLAGVYQTIIAVPLVAHDETYGALELFYAAQRAVSDEHIDLSMAFAQQGALAIENARLRSEAEQRLADISRRQHVAEGLRDLLAVINSNHTIDEILAEVLTQSSRLLGNDAGAVYLRERQTDPILHVRAAVGLMPDQVAREVRVGSPTTGLAVERSKTLVCWDLRAALGDASLRASDTRLEDMGSYARIVRLGAQTDPDLEPNLLAPRVHRLVDHFRAVLSVPLVAHGRTFGAITLFYAEPRPFSTEEIDLANAFAQQATLAIENAHLHAEAEHRMRENEGRRRVAEAMRDLLAVVNSTRSLDEILDHVLAQAADLLGSDAGSILLLDEASGPHGVLTVRASRALVSEIMPMRLPVGTAITGVAVERRRPAAVSDLMAALPLSGEPLPVLEDCGGYLKLLRIGDPGPDTVSAHGFPRVLNIARYYRALLAVPLLIHGQVQGAITLYYRQPRDFGHDEVGLAKQFADQTALAMENARLHAQAVQRTRDLEALYRADEALYRSLQLDQVLQSLVDVAADVLQSDMTSVLVWDERHKRLVPGATRGFRPEVVAQMAHAPGEGITTRVALSGQPIAVEDAPNDPRVAHRITDVEGIQSLLHVPIKVNGEVFGVFGVNYRRRRTLAGAEERVLLALAHRAAVAIEHAQVYAESEARLHELEALYRADETLHRSLRLDDVLHALAAVATEVLQADKTSVHIWDAERGELVTAAAHGYAPDTVVESLVPQQDRVVLEMLHAGVLVIEDAVEDPRISDRLREVIRRERIQSAIGVPITIGGHLFGVFAVAFCQHHTPSHTEQRLVSALAQRAGLAIQNARLFEQAQQAATTEERQRLARELHDAVTQTLFSASLMAEVVPRLWERNPDEGRRRLEDIRRLTRGALAEMRTLLLELRPAALIETPFARLLGQLAEATASRTNLQVDVEAEGEPWTLPPEVQIALYRIAQEALNNTGKHAAASHAAIHVRWQPAGVELRMTDDGRGFQQTRGTGAAGRLGLEIMHERARSIAARLKVHSRPGAGTQVSVAWRNPVASRRGRRGGVRIP